MRRRSIVPLTIVLALGCGGTTTDARRNVDPEGDASTEPRRDASTGPVEWCTGAVALSNSSQGDAFCVVKTDKSLWCWGSRGCGQLGTAVTSFTTLPVAVAPTGLGARFESVSVGWGTTCAVESTGPVACWGSSLPWVEGQCPGSPTVTQPQGLPDQISMIATGYDHACALAADGSAWCWGTNTAGQLGDGTVTDRAAGAGVVGLTSGVAAIAAGHSDSCALKTDGSLWCWGLNYTGQLGDGTTETRTKPVSVFGMSSGVTGVSLGNAHGCAVKRDGSVWCWGLNTTGQLGDGSVETTAAPVRAKVPVRVKAVSAGTHTCALADDGTVWCWGRDVQGSLGYAAAACDAAVCSSSTPAPVSGLPSDVIAVTAGYLSTCALDRDGTAWCWGSNHAGQLGDGKRTSRSIPKRVLPCGG
jgi:alpha-tubulin suppressor-like RCC1 family protein